MPKVVLILDWWFTLHTRNAVESRRWRLKFPCRATSAGHERTARRDFRLHAAGLRGSLLRSARRNPRRRRITGWRLVIQRV